MLVLSPCLCLLLIHHVACLVAASTRQQFLPSSLILRNATSDDAAAIANVLSAAFDPSPPFQYRYQFRDKYPVEHWRCTYESVLQALAVPFLTLQVIVLPENRGLGDGSLVSVAGWLDPRGLSRQDWNSGHALASKCSHKDENSTRAADFDQKFSKAQHKYLNDVYGSNQFYLAVLATHPDFQGRGYGEQLVLSGIDMAPTLGLDVVTLIATPMGEPVYFSLGFQSIANFSVTSIDGDMAFPYDVMIHS
ncbi:hypothetical protein LTS15_005707 [Exophiala xenobiotica]|nr:hypothetical protein LTS15_005707 [Exophiala xenobiotica]